MPVCTEPGLKVHMTTTARIADRAANTAQAVTARLGGRGGIASPTAHSALSPSQESGTQVGRVSSRTAWRQYGVAQPAPRAR